MSRIKAVRRILLGLWKTAHASVLPQGFKALLPAGQELMGVALMPHIPDNLIPGQIKAQMQSHGQLHNTEIGCQMPSR